MLKRGFIRVLLVILSFSLLATPVFAEGGIVLVLSGGGARGLAHIGVLEEVEKTGVPIVGVVGTSMGSIIGGLYAAGYNSRELREIADELDLNRLLKDRTEAGFAVPDETVPDRAPMFYRRQYDENLQLVGPKGGIRGDRLFDFLGELFARTSITNFDDLPIPFAAVATDLETGQAVVMRKGSLAAAVRGSMSIPGVFTPWNYEGHLLVDGGLVANLPVSIAQHLFPGYPVVAVDVSGGNPTRIVRTVADVIDRTISIMTQQSVITEMTRADLVIVPETSDVKMLAAPDPEEIVERGVVAARQALPSLKALAAKAPVPPARIAAVPETVVSVEIQGLPQEGYGAFRQKTDQWVGEPVDVAKIQSALDDFVQRDDIDTAHFETRSHLEGTDLIVVVDRAPVYEAGISLYATNMGPNRWLYLRGRRRDLWEEGDLLKGYLALGEQLGAGLYYNTEWGVRTQMGFGLNYQEREVTPRGGTELEWDAYTGNLGWSFSKGAVTFWLGAQGQFIRFNGDDEWYVGPFASLVWQNLDDEIDPTRGGAAHMDFWLTDEGDLLGRGELLGLKPVNSLARYFMIGGFELGNDEHPYHAAYLGDAEELYSLGDHPLRGERAAWVRVGRRQSLTQSFLGALDTEIFGGYGLTFDDDWDRIDDAWEFGLALNAPFVIMDSRLFVTYDDNEDWTFGFSLGTPHQRFGPTR